MPVSFYSAGGFYGFLCGFLRTSIRIVGFCPRLFFVRGGGPESDIRGFAGCVASCELRREGA